jgi:gliding motility-associated protein GldL
MSIGELLLSKRAKVILGYVYGWGASVVMIGALFKLQHWQHSGFFLTVGLLTEAVIFFVSAFEPPLEMPEWSRVYPQLREDFELNEDLEQIAVGGKSKFEELFAGSDLTPELLGNVSKGLTELSNTARGISDISSATIATDLYVKNMSSASESMSTLAQVNTKAHESIHGFVNQVVTGYSATAQQLSETGKHIIEKMNHSGEEFTAKLTESGNLLSSSYKKASDVLSTELNGFNEKTRQYSDNIEKLNKNIHSLNDTYESQLKGTSDQFKVSQKFSNDMTAMNDMLASSIDELKKYKSNAEQLNKNLEALNTIYGNMLGAMNYKK